MDSIPRSGNAGNAIFGAFNDSASGDTTLVAAVAGRKIRVVALTAVTTLANSVHFRSNATPITATFPLAANGGVVLPVNELGWFETAIGEALAVNMTVATATGLQIVYVMVG